MLTKEAKVAAARAVAEGLVKGVVEAATFRVEDVDVRPTRRNPSPPFTTSTLQQEAARKLGFSASHTMRVAQTLYEAGAITYMRTDGVQMDGSAISAARGAIANRYDGSYVPDKPRHYQTKAKNAQEAHEAIRPTDPRLTPARLEGVLDGDDLKVYDLIWKRTMASQMVDARVLRTTLELTADAPGGEKAIFSASGKAIEFAGFRRAYVEGSDDPAAELEEQEASLRKSEEGHYAQQREVMRKELEAELRQKFQADLSAERSRIEKEAAASVEAERTRLQKSGDAAHIRAGCGKAWHRRVPRRPRGTRSRSACVPARAALRGAASRRGRMRCRASIWSLATSSGTASFAAARLNYRMLTACGPARCSPCSTARSNPTSSSWPRGSPPVSPSRGSSPAASCWRAGHRAPTAARTEATSSPAPPR